MGVVYPNSGHIDMMDGLAIVAESSGGDRHAPDLTKAEGTMNGPVAIVSNDQ